MNQTTIGREPVRGSDVLAIGFGTTVAMWIVGYLLHMPLVGAAPWVTFAAIVVLLAGGGYVLGRYSPRTWRGAIVLGLVIAAVNLLVVGSVVSGAESRHTLMVGLPGYVAATLLVVCLGYAIGRRRRPAELPGVNLPGANLPGVDWTGHLATTAVFATGLVVLAGGLVTGFDAGFSVPDWPNTYGSNMFLFPLSKMTGGIYYEHTHRLAGTLVGLIAITLVVHTLTGPAARSVKLLSVAALIMVCLQGVAGGVWVTDVQVAEQEAERMAAPVEATPHLPYILFHGTFGQVVLGVFVIFAAMRSRAWREAAPVRSDTASTDRFLAAAFIIAMLIQLMLGVVLRKTGNMLLMHITFAALVATLGIGVGVRAWAVRGAQHPALRRVGKALLIVLGLQLLLGLGALYHRGLNPTSTVVVGSDDVSTSTEALITTLHQTTGAILLALAAAAGAWTFHLLRPLKVAPAQPGRPPSTSADATPHCPTGS